MNQTEAVEFVTEQQVGVDLVRERHRRVLAVVEWKSVVESRPLDPEVVAVDDCGRCPAVIVFETRDLP